MKIDLSNEKIIKTIKVSSIIILIIISFSSCKENENFDDEKAILSVLKKAEIGWNSGDLITYMDSYWHSDSLIFVGGKEINLGWDNTLKGYQKAYPDKATMGKLTFSNIRIFFKENKTAVITGKWALDREGSNPKGRYTLVFRKLPEGWKIVYDHSS